MSDARHRLTVPADDARRVALVWAVEGADPRGRLLDLGARQAATVAALAERGDRAERFLPHRARALAEPLVAPGGPLPERLLGWTDPLRGVGVPLALAALIVGLVTDALGDRRVHVLALPLLGVLVWNLGVLVLLLGRKIMPLPGGDWLGRVLARARWAAVRRLALRRSSGGAASGKEAAGSPPSVRQAIARFLDLWGRAATPLAVARAERALHGAALALVAGILGGMYLRGLGFAYQATWESTFLAADTVQGLLDAVLGPASAVTGIAVPSVGAIRAPAYGPAAPWIHLWAVTAALAVGLPRLLLLALAAIRCGRRRARLDLDLPAGYLRRLLSAADPQARQVAVVAVSYRPPADVAGALKGALLDLFGARAEVRTVSLDYGDPLPEAEPDSRCRLLLFSLAQTPEDEVHGRLIRSAAGALADGQSLLVVVDASAYRRRLGESADERLAERQRAWERALAETPVEACFTDLDRAEELGPSLLARAHPANSLDDLRRLA